MSQERQECAAMAAAQAPPSLSPSCPVLQHHAAVYFGLSCALAALHRAPSGVAGCDLGARQCRWSRARELALREKVGELEHDVEELRRRRTEDARANEKVAGIFAAHEQRWFAERNALRRQVHAVVAAARARKLRHDEATAELTQQLEEQRRAVGLKDDAMEQEAKTHEEAEEKLRVSERAGEELRERARMDAQVHAAELRKHKAAFVELASAKQQLEAELARAARHADSAEAELKAALERRDEAAAELSAEAARLRQDAEHKDKILSAMLRKSKIDMEDREMLVREVKTCKARRKQAELEAERCRKMWESRGHRRGSRSSARCAAVDHPGCSDKLAPVAVACAHDTKILFVDHVEAEGKEDRQAAAAAAKELTTVESVDRYPRHVDDKPVVEEYRDLQEWFQMETEKHTTMIRHQHSADIEAFTEQLRLKDEKLEPFRWRMVSMDVEATRLRCRIQELEGRLSQYEQHSAGLEALLLDRENENRSLKEQLVTFQARAFHSEICPADDEGGNDTYEHCIPCSPVNIQKTESRGAERTTCAAQCSEVTEITNANHDHAENHVKLTEPVSRDNRKNKAFDMEAIEAYDVSVLNDTSAAAPDKLIDQDQRPNVPTDHPYRSEIEQEKEVCTDPGNAHTQTSTTGSQEATSDVALAAPPEQKLSAWKMDIQALAVSYKIKRLKQQLLVLEKLAAAGGKEATTAAKPSSNEASGGGSGSRQQPRSYQLMMSFLSKHVKRYKSLEDKIDDLCTRMEESKRSGGRERQSAGSREQSAALGQFLEETFQLQRYMVATGQKLLEMQSRIAPSLARGGEADGVDMGRFMDVVGALLRDVQRGFEVRISRIIGDLEGTLTFHGILQTTL